MPFMFICFLCLCIHYFAVIYEIVNLVRPPFRDLNGVIIFESWRTEMFYLLLRQVSNFIIWRILSINKIDCVGLPYFKFETNNDLDALQASPNNVLSMRRLSLKIIAEEGGFYLNDHNYSIPTIKFMKSLQNTDLLIRG